MKFADLHLHTIFSDGTYTPAKLISEAARCGLSAISVVDHDTVEAILPTLQIAREQNIEVLPGIELTAEYEGSEIHILGYLIDYKRKQLLEKLAVLKKNRIERIYKITDKLKDIGIKLEPRSIFDIATGGTVGRLHVARAMVKEGLVGSIFEAFRKYIGDKCPAYVLGFRLSPHEAIGLIKDSGGVPVLAHPYIIDKDDLVFNLIDLGIMGLEAYYPEHSQSMVNFYLGLAKKYNLVVTGGSDCHGDAKPEAKIGSIKIPYDLIDKLKEAQQNTLRP
ncbi:MAG: PHP domain-containing protein [Candidatus Omnitrophica bacterium]|nr:PHP domain-containing protein [Candidatus Omnitrophota bacterium]MDD5592328.1 PHP domain-containing protein [Candidatus Omnitrophota bacterium]